MSDGVDPSVSNQQAKGNKETVPELTSPILSTTNELSGDLHETIGYSLGMDHSQSDTHAVNGVNSHSSPMSANVHDVANVEEMEENGKL